MAAPLHVRSTPARRLGWLARIALLAALCRGLPGLAGPAEAPRNAKAKPSDAAKVELHRLTNEELRKQADTIYEKASRDYLAQLRALASTEVVLEEVRKQTDGVKALPAPAGNPEAAVSPGEAPAKKAVDAAKVKQDAVKHQLKLVQTQKELLDRITTQLEGCRSAAVAFQNALDDLKGYALESELRVKDGTLAKDKVPGGLKPDFLDKKRGELLDGLARLKKKTAGVRKGQEAVARLLEDTSKAALAADADTVEAGKALVREQQRQQLEKAYAGKKRDEMLPELARMVEEGIGLNGSYELALQKFDAGATVAARLRKQRDALSLPRAKVTQVARPEDVETAAKSVQELIRFHAARAQKLEKLRTALVALAREGAEFEAEAAVSEEHLFKMQVVAGLLKKDGVADAELPEEARTAQLDATAARHKESAAAVRAATAKAKAELSLLGRQLTDAGAAGEAAAKQLANLKESRDVTLAALKWEGRLNRMTAREAVAAFTATSKELADRLGKLKLEADAYDKATVAAADATARLNGLKDPFLRAAEEQGQAEKHKLLGELRKAAGLERATREAAPPAPAPEPKKPNADGKQPPDTRTELARAAERLSAFQQLLAGRVRVVDERQAKTKDLLAALDGLDRAAAAYSKSLAAARLLALQRSATAVDLKKRLGKGELGRDAIPEGVADALRLELRTQLDAAGTSVLNARNRLQQDRDKLRAPDPDGDKLTAATTALLVLVGRRLDLLADLKRLDMDYRREKSARPPSEVKRLEQLAADRERDESSGLDTLLGIDTSKNAKSLSELLESYYRELIETEEKQESLKKQRETVDQLVELARQEVDALARLRPLLARQLARLEAAREEESVLAHARLRPDQAEELLKAYHTKTGKLLSKPPPVPDKDKAEQIEILGDEIFDRHVALEAGKKWDDVLNARAAPTGVPAEAGVYQDELTRINAASAANARRVLALTGREERGPATGGEIASSRGELTRVRAQGVKRIGLQIGAILLAMVLVPRLLVAILRRTGGWAGEENSSLILAALRVVLKITVWVVGLAMIMSVLGFDITAVLAGLGIGGLAIALAAQAMIADVIAALVIIVEGRFKIGDVVRLGGGDPVRVIGLTWRSTQVKDADGLVVNIPNRKVTEAAVQNLTKAGGTYDSLNVAVTTEKEVSEVLAVIEKAMAACEHVAADRGVAVKEFTQKGHAKTIEYRFWWLLRDYEARNKTRDEVFASISAGLAHEDMVGTEISLA
jgi:small-conductance mechanosensitive channel